MRGLGRLLVLQVVTVLLFAGEPCSGQSAPSDALEGKSSQLPDPQQEGVRRSIPDRPPYHMDRSEENWSFLQGSSLRSDFWYPIKYIRLGREGWYLSLGGEFRPMYEFDKNNNWGEGPQDDNGFYLNRLIGSAGFHFGSHARVFFELKSGLEFGRNGGPRPSIDEDKLDLSQLFVDVPVSKERLPFVIRVGRQELNYGDGSLLAIRELNVRREFDGIKLLFRPEGWSVDAFAMRPVTIKPGFFDDPPDHEQTFQADSITDTWTL
jgi:Alginate export